ncbi:MAG: DNA polymerase III subunit alpha [Candidatus Andersenbacteria bacterium]
MRSCPKHSRARSASPRSAALTSNSARSTCPSSRSPPSRRPSSSCAELCEAGVKVRYGVPYSEASKEIKDRIEYELGVISKTGFANYTLIVNDYVNWAKRQGIVVGPGRGSAAGSLVSYLLRITDIDPLKWGLFFERYMNPARVSFPDIDSDFDDARRDEVIDYVAKKYGRERVAQIITFGTIKARNAIRDAGRVLDVPYAVCDRLAKMIPMKLNLDQALAQVGELKQTYVADPQARQLIDAARKLEGVARNAGTHACGVVISDVPLDELVPCQFATRGTETTQQVTTQFDLHGCEDIGLIKMDFLGLSNLTIIQHALDLIKKRWGRTIDLSTLPLDDAATFKLLQDARTVGVFQLESSGMRRYLKELKPTELEDIVAMVSLYRPGPMENIPTYIERKHSGHVPPLLHPKLEPILKSTYGVAVYQEQVMEISQQLAGFTLGEGYLLVKAVAKKIRKLLDEQRGKFIEGCEKTGVGRKIGEQLFAFIEPFAQYGFNRAHAVCYAMIAYQTAYLKATYPAEFMAALLRSDEDDTDRLAIEIGESQKMGLRVLPPSVNQSYKHFTVVNLGTDGAPLADGRSLHQHIDGVAAGVRFGLAGIKNLGSDAVEQIIRERDANGPFASLGDLAARIDPLSLNKKSLEALAMSGALDEFGERAAIIATIPTLLTVARSMAEAKNSKQQGLFGAATEQATPRVQLASAEPAPRMQRLKWEKALLGLYVSEQPLAEHRELIEQRAMPVGWLRQEHVNRTVRCVGLVSAIQKVVTRAGEPMLFVQLDDFSGNLEALIFPSILKEHGSIIAPEAVLVVTGKVSDKDGQLKLLANAVAAFDPAQLAKAAPVESRTPTYIDRPAPDAPLATPAVAPVAAPPPAAPVLAAPPPGSLELLLEQAFSVDKLRELKACLQGLPTGDAPVLLRVKDGPRERRIRTNYKIAANPAIRARLEEIVGRGRVNG